LRRLIFLSEQHLRITVSTFVDYYRRRRNHQGIGNKLIEPPVKAPGRWPHPMPKRAGWHVELLLPGGSVTSWFSSPAEFFGSTRTY